MYAIVNISGKQFKVIEGVTLKVPGLKSNPGDEVKFESVLLTDDGKTVKIGTPIVKGVQVTANIVEHGRERKVLIYKKKRRKGYNRKNGHRQTYTLIKINSIGLTSKTKKTTSATKKKSTKKSEESN